MKAQGDYDELLSPYTPYTSKLTVKKDFFIQSRQEDIRNFYEFYPKVLIIQCSPLEEEDMVLSLKLNLSNHLTLIESLRSSTRG
jgi:hypothetical protein